MKKPGAMQCPVDPTSEETKDMSRATRILTLSLCLAVLAIVAVASPSWAAREAYLVVNGQMQGVIQGDSTAKIAPGAIVVQAIGLGLSIPTSSTTGGGQTIGRASVEPLKIAKFPDKASPKLLLAALTNEPLKVDLTWFGADLAGAPVAKSFSITLEGALIVGIETSGATTVVNGVTEEVSFVFNKLTFRDERTSPATVTCWDLIQNKKC
jgi:type VI secretion system Hcp family effector